MATHAEIEDWLARLPLGDRQAFSDLYDATSAKLFGLCLRVLKDRTEAEEALQDAFVKIWRGADQYRATGHSPMTWLITVTRNTAIDRLRARKARQETEEMPETLATATPTPEASAVATSEARRIFLCFDELDPSHAGAVRGAYLEGLSYRELAALYSVPMNTMRTWLRRSLVKLKECLRR